MFRYFVVSLNVNAIPMSTRSVLNQFQDCDSFYSLKNLKQLRRLDKERRREVKQNKNRIIKAMVKFMATIRNLWKFRRYYSGYHTVLLAP